MIKRIQQEILSDLPGWAAHKNMAPPMREPSLKAPSNVRYSAVCVLVYYKENDLHTLLIKRAEDGKTHSGQIGFPGGKLDDNDFSMAYCALRECNEEVALPIENIHMLGGLSKIYIPPSNFIVSPIACTCSVIDNLIPSENEVAEIIEAPLTELFDDANKNTLEVYRSEDRSKSMHTPIYQFRQHTIWGATAMMLAELEEIYKRSL